MTVFAGSLAFMVLFNTLLLQSMESRCRKSQRYWRPRCSTPRQCLISPIEGVGPVVPPYKPEPRECREFTRGESYMKNSIFGVRMTFGTL